MSADETYTKLNWDSNIRVEDGSLLLLSVPRGLPSCLRARWLHPKPPSKAPFMFANACQDVIRFGAACRRDAVFVCLLWWDEGPTDCTAYLVSGRQGRRDETDRKSKQ